MHRVVPEWMHCTLVHAIGADADSDPVSGGIGRLVEDVEPFTLTLGRPDIGQVAVEAAGWPSRPHQALVEHVVAAHQLTRTGCRPASTPTSPSPTPGRARRTSTGWD
ncbi:MULTISPECIES: hypothetical protein [unclassified Streptomyces]|uniref:hypothetical protein n=1 Tax=unclassified Streptomyces TaxID=2593676 RepID=UPI003076FE6C